MYKNILIKNGRLFDGQRFYDGDVLIENGCIAQMGTVAATDVNFTYDAAGMTVCPGLVDIHAHMSGVTDDVYAPPAEASMFPFGVTAAVEASACHGDRKRLDRMLLDTAMFISIQVRDDRAYFEKTEQLLEAFGDRAVGVKVFFDTSNPELRSIAPLQQAVAFAREHGLKVMVHSTGSPVPMLDIVKTLGSGDILSHFYHGGQNRSDVDDFAAWHLAKEKGVVIDVGMAGHVHTDFALLGEAIKKGFLPDTLGSDITCFSAFTRGGNYGLTLCMSVLRDLGMPEEDVFRLVTVNPAAAVGKEGIWGCLKVGMPANLAVLDYGRQAYDFNENPANRISGTHGYRCRLTVCQGKVVSRNDR